MASLFFRAVHEATKANNVNDVRAGNLGGCAALRLRRRLQKTGCHADDLFQPTPKTGDGVTPRNCVARTADGIDFSFCAWWRNHPNIPQLVRPALR